MCSFKITFTHNISSSIVSVHVFHNHFGLFSVYTVYREAGAVRSQIPPLSLVSAHPNRHAVRNGVEGCIQRSLSEKLSPLLVPCRSAMRRTFSILSMEDISVGSWDSGRRGSFPSSCREEASSHSSSSFELPIDDVFAVHQNTAPCHDQVISLVSSKRLFSLHG
jgi:hypothetical protein